MRPRLREKRRLVNFLNLGRIVGNGVQIFGFPGEDRGNRSLATRMGPLHLLYALQRKRLFARVQRIMLALIDRFRLHSGGDGDSQGQLALPEGIGYGQYAFRRFDLALGIGQQRRHGGRNHRFFPACAVLRLAHAQTAIEQLLGHRPKHGMTQRTLVRPGPILP